ncbi:MAG: hypothetical protein GWN01_13830, partial [Nitrosopumilaceae archaeon]|nr:hypothetical protein [Nitrosopumilaceae archaeon]NIU88344.1 hypothetical protein [Nitrosopumilaceae archaeon]NIV66632.1 hypothetical protein [Nitrosopumilaceae archaeon]NIX62544.1 hypothetical protein [Nitrosopumilaceae archaeon]
MYSGYIVSELVSIPKNVYLIRPEIKNLNKTIAELTVKISQKKCVVILDSLNGFLNFLGEENPGRLANSYIMLLASNAKMSDSAVIISSISKYKKEEGWVLVPTGRHVMENDNIKKFYLQTSGPSLTISKIENGKHIQIFVVD